MGVEPVIRAVQRALDNSLGSPFTHLTSLDFGNAFNTLDRRHIAQGLRSFGPTLYRAGKWAYGSLSDLVMASDLAPNAASSPTISSVQGV